MLAVDFRSDYERLVWCELGNQVLNVKRIHSFWLIVCIVVI